MGTSNPEPQGLSQHRRDLALLAVIGGVGFAAVPDSCDEWHVRLFAC
ncbi:hypothetical protein [Kribbella sp. NBC_00889]|nr:hypothetical protein OG817_25745 [Kribbella sp. NBC_00889]